MISKKNVSLALMDVLAVKIVILAISVENNSICRNNQNYVLNIVEMVKNLLYNVMMEIITMEMGVVMTVRLNQGILVAGALQMDVIIVLYMNLTL